MRNLLLAVAAALVAAAAAAASAPDQAPQKFGRGTATVTTRTHKVVLRVEIARTDAQRARGLMFRRSLAADAGMAFLYEEPSSGGFWMKNTLIPLDIAFYDVRGRVVRTFRMEPCERDPCRLYEPGVTYRGALEVRAGSFRRWNLRRGDTIAVRTATTR